MQNWKVGVVSVDCSSEAVVEVALLVTFISILVTGCLGFCTRGGTPPFRPLPFGMSVVKKLVTLGVFFFDDRKGWNCPLVSATATEWEQIPSDFQFGQLESTEITILFRGHHVWCFSRTILASGSCPGAGATAPSVSRSFFYFYPYPFQARNGDIDKCCNCADISRKPIRRYFYGPIVIAAATELWKSGLCGIG